MPYKKGGAAEQRAKLRRTANRRIASLERSMERSDSVRERELFKAQIDKQRELVSQTYIRNPLTHKATGYTQDELKIAAQNLMRANEASKDVSTSKGRKNFITQQELNHAMPYSQDTGRRLSKFTKEEVSVFYRATQNAWEGLSSEDNRNKAILRYYTGRSWTKGDFEQFVNDVLAQNEEAVSRAHEASEKVKRSEDLAPEEGEQQRPGSTEWDAYVIPAQYIAGQSIVNRPE